MPSKIKDLQDRTRRYILNRDKSGNYWKLSTGILTLIILVSLYSKGIIAIATINNRPVTVNELIHFLRRDQEDNIIDRALTQKLIEIEARKRQITVTSQETEKEIKRLTVLAAKNGKTIYELLQTSEEDGRELEKNVKLRMTLYKIMSSGNPITENEIDSFIDNNEDLYKPEEKEIIRTELKGLLLNKKISEDYDGWIREVNAADVDYIIDLDNI